MPHSQEERPRILVVDDEKVIREILADFLSMEGFWVRTAEDGAAALVELGGHGGRRGSLRERRAPVLHGRPSCCGGCRFRCRAVHATRPTAADLSRSLQPDRQIEAVPAASATSTAPYIPPPPHLSQAARRTVLQA